MAAVLVSFFLLSICKLIIAATAGQLVSGHFQRCPRGQIYNAPSLAAVHGRTAGECAAICLQTTGCVASNVCPAVGGEGASCSLLATENSQTCVGLSAAAHSDCFHMSKMATSICQNGGTESGEKCTCPLPYTGTLCERIMRDCSEGYANGYNTSSYDGPYLIQPLSSPAPFMVNCGFAYSGGTTIPFSRTTLNFSRDWASVKAGFGDDLATTPESWNHFIGLDNLRLLLSQASYQLHILAMYNGWASKASAFYNNFTMKDEVSFYEINYANFFSVHTAPSDNGLSAAVPVRFATLDHQSSTMCASNRGGSGWYGMDCSGYSLFHYNFTWPINGTAWPLNAQRFVLVRSSDYYDV